MRQRLDQQLVSQGLVSTRSQAESYIKLGYVSVDNTVVTKPGILISEQAHLRLTVREQYVSRAALKLDSIAQVLELRFEGKVVLDVGSSTGGFTDFALRHGARKVIAVELGTEQLHPSLRADPRIELHEKTDIREVYITAPEQDTSGVAIAAAPDMVLADVSFISLREILPAISRLSTLKTDIVVMVKPQFEAPLSRYKHKGVIKNDHLRREILHDFETWANQHFYIMAKADSEVTGAKGNKERFYLMHRLRFS